MFKKPKVDWSPDNAISATDLNRIEGNIKSLGVLPIASGNGSSITLDLDDIDTLDSGTVVEFIANANNGGLATKINNRPLYKPNTTSPPSISNGKAYSAWYNKQGDCFFLKASAEGTALASQVIAGKTFSNDDSSGIIGTLDLSLLASGNIRAGVTINGIIGSSQIVDTTDASAYKDVILAGYSAYIKGSKVIGTMPYYNNNAHVTAQDKTAGVYSPNDPTNYAYTRPTAGYYDGTAWARIAQPDLVPANILAGKSIMNVVGNATLASLGGYKVKMGTTASSSTSSLTISGFDFTPTFGMLFNINEDDTKQSAIIYEANSHNVAWTNSNIAELYGYTTSGNEHWTASNTPNQNAVFSNGTWSYVGAYPSASVQSSYAYKGYFYIFIGN